MAAKSKSPVENGGLSQVIDFEKIRSISMAIFNSYVELPESNINYWKDCPEEI